MNGISKIYERVISDQLMSYCEHVMSDFLCAFRKEHGCHTVLLKLVEDWKAALDDKKVVGAMLMDLSRAFDCLPHRLLLAKLSAYGLDDKACNLLMSYLRKRQQRVKVGMTKSDWTTILKGIPQGSILGPLLFNIFINDLLFSLTQMNSCTIYNYADDNSISFASHSLDDVKINVERSTEVCLNWFMQNHMQANPAKFQSMILGNVPQQKRDTFTFKVGNENISPSDTVKLLGIHMDSKLNFDKHIQTICRRAASQLKALFRLRKALTIGNKMNILNGFILAHFNYCPVVWHHCGLTNSRKIEKIQERGLRFVYNDFESTYNQLLEQSNKNLLYVSRIKSIACEAYKSINHVGPPLLHDMIKVKDITNNLRDEFRAIQKKTNSTRHGLKSFQYEGAKIWNNLPINIKQSTSYKHFKCLISKWDGPQCKCGACILCL